MRTIRDGKCLAELIARFDKLTPESKAAWGRMSVEQMLSHLVQTCEMPFEGSVPDSSNWASRNILKPLVLYLLPVPKGVKTSAELDQQQSGRKPNGFDLDRARVVESIKRLGEVGEDYACLDHPFFGKMSARQWAVMAHKHIDHHLRQFGV